MDDWDDWDVSGLHDSEENEMAESDSRDRLSELPDSLIHFVLSFLDMKYVVRTTFLSKRWNNLWTSVPCLNFRCLSYDLDSFKNFVNRTLALWKGTKVVKFSLNFLIGNFISRDVDPWLLFSIEKQVEELYVHFGCYNHNPYSGKGEFYALHQRLFSCSSITKLCLINCEIKIDDDKRVEWNQLESLSIEGYELSIEEDTINRILFGAHRLKLLKLHISGNYNEILNIESTSLKMLKLHRSIGYHMRNGEANNTTLRISAPNLETLEISGVSCSIGRCLLNVPCLTNAVLEIHYRGYNARGSYFDDVLVEEMFSQVFLSIRRVESLRLSPWCSKVLVELKKKDKLVEFSNVETLKLCVGAADEILVVLEMFPKLMMLILEIEDRKSSHLPPPSNPRAVSIVEEPPRTSFLISRPSLPHLKRVEITWHPRDTSILPVAEILLSNAHMLEKMVFRFKSYGAVLGSLFSEEEKLLSMSRSSPTAEVIVIKDS